MVFIRADEFEFNFLLLSSKSVFQLGLVSGRTFLKFKYRKCISENKILVGKKLLNLLDAKVLFDLNL